MDDIFDTGLTLATVIETLLRDTDIAASNIKIATPWYKPANNRTELIPDFYLHETRQWVVFPHELAGLSGEEIASGKPELSALNAN